MNYLKKDSISTVIDEIDFSVLAFGKVHATKDQISENVYFTNYRLCCVAKGSYAIEKGITKFTADTSDILLFPANQIFSSFALDENNEYYYIDFKIVDTDQQKKFNSMFGLNEILHLKNILLDWQFESLHYLNNSVLLAHHGNYLLVKATLLRLFVSMAKYLKDTDSTYVINHAQTTKEQLLLEIIDFIEANIDRKVTVKKIAEHFNYSENYIYKIFNDTLQISCKTFILDYRLSLSVQYLRSTSLSIAQIAKDCGFSSVHHFSNAFKAKFGCSPLKYRKDL